MESTNKPLKKINKTPTNKRKAINRDRVIKKRIEMLLTVGVIGLVIGLIVGILLPIGGIKKSEYNELKNANEKIKSELNDANKKVEELKNEIEESKIFMSLEDEKKEQVINYIGALANEEQGVNTTDIFEKVYNVYAYSIGYESFVDFNSVIDTFGYQYNITEEADIKKVVLKDEYVGDFVTLQFKKINANQELILYSIRYNKGDKYIEVNNTDEANIEYITYNGTKTNANNVNEQVKFLFNE